MAVKKAFPKRPDNGGVTADLAKWLDLIPQLIKSDVYTPTLSNTTNLDGSTAFSCPYIRVGDVVVIGLSFQANPTATGAVELGVSLPIASNFSNADADASGNVSARAIVDSGAVEADTANNRLSIKWVATDTANRNFSGVAIYRII